MIKNFPIKSILVADDDDFNFFVIESMLLQERYELIHARNGKEAIQVFRSHGNISLVLMDIQMPVMDGITATKEIRRMSTNVPIIAQTSYAFEKVKEKAITAGCDDFLTKPLSSENLISTIKKHIQ